MDPRLKEALADGQKLLDDPETSLAEATVITQTILLTTILDELQQIRKLMEKR